jgi:predicted TPR repeat methyltransferase
MPVSIHIQVTHCLDKIIQLQPRSVLDIGCGFGKWGYLCREYLDVFPGRPFPEQWTTRIDGIEFFEPYIMAHQRFLYSNIYIGDVRDLCKGIDDYDLIIAGDVIEHLFKDEAETVLETLYARAKKLLIVNIPLGEGWIHPEQYGNPAELHRSEWYVEDFVPFNANCAKYGQEDTLQYGCFFCEKGAPDADRAAGYLHAADFYANRGNTENALRYIERARTLAPNNPDVLCFMVDFQIKQGKREEAVATLRQGLEASPDFDKGYIYLAQLLESLGRGAEACAAMRALLGRAGADPACRAEASQWLEKRGGG